MNIKSHFSKSLFFLFLIPSIIAFSQEPGEENYRESCTSIMVGRKATDDGSVITAHTCDAYYRTWLQFVPAQKFERDTTHKIFWGTMHTHTPWSMDKVELKGEIPEADSTFAYLNTAYPCINEKQLAIGETTISGRKELQNNKGLFLIEELQRIALQRCTTARDAINLIGSLIKEYGYGDAGECITIADKREVWQMEIFGEGPHKIGGVWAAQRVPDDHVGISANITRIAEIKTDQPDFYMFSENVFKVAKEMGFWDGEKIFKFWEAYGGNAKPFNIREYFVFSTLAPGLKLKYDSPELPFSVKPEKKLNVRQVLELYRTTYDGTEWEMIRNLKVPSKRKDADGKEVIDTIVSPAAHPWMAIEKRDLLNSLEKDAVAFFRPISVQFCAYSWVAQLREDLPDEIGGRLFFSFDVPRLSPRIPIYCGNLNLPGSFNFCGQDHFSRESALWAFRRTNRLAMVNWTIGKAALEPEVLKEENKVFDEIDFIEKRASELLVQDKENLKNGKNTQLCQEYLTDYSNSVARSVIDKWWELGDDLWVKMRWKF
jgi:dipeptidase